VARCCAFFEKLCRIWWIVTNRRKTGDRCVYFPERVINRPDPCIYDQFLLMQLGKPVTWDSPDIATSLAITAPGAVFGIDEIRLRAAPGSGLEYAFPSFNEDAHRTPILHCELSSHIGDYAVVGGAVGSAVGLAWALESGLRSASQQASSRLESEPPHAC
jgi:hypothetical protein